MVIEQLVFPAFLTMPVMQYTTYLHRTESNLGLFGSNSGVVKNLHLVNFEIWGVAYVGALAGHNSGAICNIFVHNFEFFFGSANFG